MPSYRSRRVVPGILVVALAVSSFWSGDAQAQAWVGGPPPKTRFVHRNSLFLRWNPIGFIYDARFIYRQRLYYEDSEALSDNFVGIGLAPSASPAFVRLGAYVEFQPLSLLTLWANYEVIGYTGLFNFLQSFPSADSDFRDSKLSELGRLPAGDPAKNYPTTGTQLLLVANFQVRLGNVAVRSQFRAMRPDMNLRSGDRVFYDIFYDILAPNRGWMMTNDADVMWQSDLGPKNEQLTLGLRHTWTQAFYGPEHFESGVAQADPNTPMHRLGPLLAYTFFQENRRWFNAPTIFVALQWWLSHRFRLGADSPQAVPLIAVGFSMNGDILNMYGGRGAASPGGG